MTANSRKNKIKISINHRTAILFKRNSKLKQGIIIATHFFYTIPSDPFTSILPTHVSHCTSPHPSKHLHVLLTHSPMKQLSFSGFNITFGEQAQKTFSMHINTNSQRTINNFIFNAENLQLLIGLVSIRNVQLCMKQNLQANTFKCYHISSCSTTAFALQNTH